jgi:hypothetical protein
LMTPDYGFNGVIFPLALSGPRRSAGFRDLASDS